MRYSPFFPGTSFWLLCLAVVQLFTGSATSFLRKDAFATEVMPSYLLDMDIEDLMKVEVTSVSKYGQLLLDAPAAITVIGNDEIRRSGLREIPELLRLAPGMQVVRQSSGSFLATARALPFTGYDKMLVLSDGRSIYSQDTGNVAWPVQAKFMEDIDRIEVIRGPGGTTWGYNAVNGVVNIISKKARQTQGLFVDTLVGTDGETIAQARFGGRLSDNVHYRLYFTDADYENFETPFDASLDNATDKMRGGFRIDYEPGEQSIFLLKGALTDASEEFGRLGDDHYRERYIQGRWSAPLRENLDLNLQFYYEKTDHVFGESDLGKQLSIGMENYASEIRVDFRPGPRNRIVAGAGFKYAVFSPGDGDETAPYFLRFHDSKERWKNYNFFLTDEIALVQDLLWLTLGAKMEYNSNTGQGWQPSARLLYKPTPTQSLWASVSRALRVPDFEDAASRTGQFLFIDEDTGGDIYVTDEYTGKHLEDERLTAYEAGYRVQATPDLSCDLALFYNDHDNVMFEDIEQVASDSFVITNNYDSEMETWGGEFSVTWQPLSSWSLTGSYAYLHSRIDFPPQEGETGFSTDINRLQLHSLFEPFEGSRLDTHLYWNDPARVGSLKMPAYFRLDMRFSYRLSEMIEVSLTGRNLLDSAHWELEDAVFPEYLYEIPRSIYLNIKVAL